jgi:hypothetical protein
MTWAGPVSAQPKNKNKNKKGGQTCWVDGGPSQLGPAQPNINNNIILYILKKQKKFKSPFKKVLIFLHIFLPILHNIRLYIYTIRYKFSIKIPSFLQNIPNFFFENSKKISKFLKLISSLKKKFMHIAKS